MKIDATGKSLWACTADGDPAEGANTARRSYLFRFDLATGKTLQKIPSPEGGRHLFNDLAISNGGEIYLTDSEEGTVYRLRPGADAVERLLPPGASSIPTDHSPTTGGCST
jgi:sugar lactone lactonase YvrE